MKSFSTLLVGFFLCFGFFFSCEKKTAPELPPPEKTEQTGTRVQPESTGDRIVFSVPATGEEKGKDEAKVLPSGGKESFLPLRDSKLVPVFDTVIGELSHGILDIQKEEIIDTLLHFFDGLKNNRVTVAPEWQDYLERTLSYHIRNHQIPEIIRFTIPDVSGDKARVLFRGMTGKGKMAGEVFLSFIEMPEAGWYVTDIQGDFQSLSKPYNGSKEPFEPESFQWFFY
ncbi:MAG: hypothetical protein KAU17_12450 [Spirochaetales bacterium]|nr:hypothetical protein [Spirochaetales bacterium]